MKKPHVAIAIPSYGQWQAESATAIMAAFNHFMRFAGSGQAGMSVHSYVGTVIPAVRNGIVKEILANPDATHIMWFDSDMIVPADVISRLLAHDVPMVAANYCSRKMPLSPTAWKGDKRIYTTPESAGLEQASFTGLGCALISTAIYRQLEQPWHKIIHPMKEGYIGEDVYFFRRAKQELGVDLWVDHDVSKEVLHQGTYNYSLQDAFMWKGSLPEPAFNIDTIDVVGEKNADSEG